MCRVLENRNGNESFFVQRENPGVARQTKVKKSIKCMRLQRNKRNSEPNFTEIATKKMLEGFYQLD